MEIIITIDALKHVNPTLPWFEKAIGPYLEALYYDNLNFFFNGLSEIYDQVVSDVSHTKYANSGVPMTYTWTLLDEDQYIELCYYELLNMHQSLVMYQTCPDIINGFKNYTLHDVQRLNSIDIKLCFV